MTKIVIRVSMIDEKARSKALKVVVGISGVESAALTGAEKDRVEVVGENIDAVCLTRALRKKVGHAELVTVGEAKKEEKKAETPALPVSVIGWHVPPPPPYYSYEVSDPICVIM